MLEVKGVSKTLYGDQKAVFRLEEIDFTLPGGYILGLFGPNGSGKTTLFHLLAGLYRADSGQILQNGRDVLEEEKVCKDEIGVVLSEDLYPGGLTLLANAELLGKYYREYDRELLLSYCKRFGLDAFRKCDALSKGEKLKYQFAFALSHKPAFLFLDEPTANFDPEFREEFLKIITEYVSDGERSIVLATHILEEIEQVADYFLFLQDGRQTFFMDRERLEESFRLVQGENYKIKLLKEERVVHAEYGKDMGKALVRHGAYSVYDREVTVTVPSVEDIMYFHVKARENQNGKR